MRFVQRLLRLVLATLISFTSLALIAQTPAAAAEGDLDASYQGGQTSTAGWHVGELHASGEDGIVDIEIDASGNVITGGWWNNNGSTNNWSWSLVRYNSAGACTEALKFDGNCQTNQWFSTRPDVMTEIMIDANGKYVAVGYADANSGSDFDCVVYRTHSTSNWKNSASDFGDGVDTSFSGDGKFVASFGSADEYCRAGAIDADGKIVIAGYYKNSSSDWDTIIGRINADGTWDTSFAGDGKFRLSFDQDDVFQDIAIQPDGKIVAVGTSDYGHTQGDILVARFTTAGALDTSFGGGDGWVRTDFENQDRGFGVELQSNGKIVVVGRCDSNNEGGGSDGLVARFTTAGVLDTTFSGDGKICQDHGGDTEIFRDLVIQADGKIFAAGNSNNGGSGADVSVARYTTAGALDTSFSGDGLAQYNSGSDGGGNWEEVTWAATTAANGNILLAGSVVQANDWDTFSMQIVSTSATPAVTMAAFGKFKKDDANSTIATHEDPNVTEVPGGYQTGNTMNSNHEFDGDYDVNGSDRTFTLVLGAQPPSNVVFDFTIGAWVGADDHVAANTTLGTDLVIKDSGNNTVTQATFTNGNWSTAQTFTVVPVQDNVIEGFENASIVATVNDAASDDMYGIMSVQKNIVIWDDDHNVTAGWDHVNGAVDGLNLKAFPSEVVMTDYMEKGEQYLVDPNNGTAMRWYCIDPTALANHGGDIGNYIRSLGQDGVWASQVWVGTQIDHDGNTTFWRSQFANKNWVSLDNMDFSTSTTAVQRYVWGSDGKLRWSDDSEVPNGETGTACTGDDRLYMGSAAKKETDTPAVPASQITVRPVTSNDPEHTQGTPTVVEGSSITFDIKLGAPPVNSEAVSFTSGYAGASFSPSSITFTNDNYNTRQTVTLSIANNDLEEGTTTNSTVTWSAYGTTGTFAYNITDNDTAAITLSKTTTSVSEAATTDTFTVVLTTDPATDVDISVISADTGEATVSTSELAFTTNNWNTPQTVTVTGVNDGTVDGNVTHNITLSVIDAQSDDTYDPVLDVVVQNTTADNDSAGFTVTQSGGSTLVAETGSTDTFTVVLTAQPASDVVLSVVSGDTGEATVDKSTLTFTNGNWAAAQTVTVTGIDDDLDDGYWQLGITLAVVDGSSADAFDNVANQTIGVINNDDDTAGFTIAHTDGATVVTENATTDTFTLVLNAQPASDVVLSVTSSDTGEVTTGSSTVTFTNGNWNTAQNVTLTGVNDDVDDGNVNTTMTIAVVDVSSSNEFDNVADQTFTVANTDNDAAAFTVNPSATTVTEGNTVTVTVVLQTSPNTNVMIDISSGDTSELTISSVTVTFTAANWNSNQTITLTAVDDADTDGNQNVTLTTAVNDAASDPAYDPLANQTVEFTVTDNDSSGGPEIIDPDYDRDGIMNSDEIEGCALLPDCDFDGVLDPDELPQCITDPDCDDDLIGDGGEIYACQLMPDCDGDGVNDVDEQNSACIQDPTCRLEALDTDNDGIYDKDELEQCILNPDCDGDGIGDKSELKACLIVADCDGDGVNDSNESPPCIQNPNCGRTRQDTDRDGLSDSFEYSIAKRCVNDSDCDDDGVPDGSEVPACILKADCDGDGAGDRYEANKACVQDPLCVPLGLSKNEQQVGAMTDFEEWVVE